jgi:toxin ParE1/3/4
VAFYNIAPEANDDLDRIWFFGLERFGVVQADKYYYALMSHFAELAETPLLHPAVNHIREGYRRSVCGSHSVYYRVHAEYVEIMRVIGQENF